MVAGREFAPMRISVLTKLFAGFGLAFTIIGTTALISLDNAARVAEHPEGLTHAQALDDELHAVVFAACAAEKSQRKFVATGASPLSVGQA